MLRPHASARWKWFADQPIFSLWRCNREDANTDALRTLVWRGEGALLVRPDATVEAIELSAGGCAFIDACGAGAQLASRVSPRSMWNTTSISALMAQLLQVGAFGEMHR